MSITRTLISTLTLIPLLAACQVYTGKPTGPAPATRLQGNLQVQDGKLTFTPCQEQRRFDLADSGQTGIDRDAQRLLGDGQSTLFADIAGQLGGSTSAGSDGTVDVTRLYRLQGEGHGCEDLNFKRLTLRASGNEPSWQVEVGGKGLVLNRPGEEPLALPYLEEQLPDDRLSFSSEANGQKLELWVAPRRCVDDMTGAVSNLGAELRLNGEVSRGCAHFGGARN